MISRLASSLVWSVKSQVIGLLYGFNRPHSTARGVHAQSKQLTVVAVGVVFRVFLSHSRATSRSSSARVSTTDLTDQAIVVSPTANSGMDKIAGALLV